MACLPCEEAARARRYGVALGDASTPSTGGFGKILLVIGSCLGLGIVGIVALELQQGWRPGRRR